VQIEVCADGGGAGFAVGLSLSDGRENNGKDRSLVRAATSKEEEEAGNWQSLIKCAAGANALRLNFRTNNSPILISSGPNYRISCKALLTKRP